MGITNSYAKINAEGDEIDNEIDYQAYIKREIDEIDEKMDYQAKLKREVMKTEIESKRKIIEDELKKKYKLISTYNNLMDTGNEDIKTYEKNRLAEDNNYDKDADVIRHNMCIMNELRHKRFMDIVKELPY